ncbi:hypothetical protein EH223_03550 [candidate division KSB1 bacterium]|nr:hypothetical protein [candidate division KSB1 bacterium]RQW05880.1 MAG: hypothetical protein EH223_03550 [candidate division KSB1 bacterium]
MVSSIGYIRKLFISTIFVSILPVLAFADGKLLRGEKWQRFSYVDTADFYVAPNGNDLWSGRHAEPNATSTDGPFATIGRAQQAVREFKKRIYKPKTEPIEKRWIGSPHEFGQGSDILVLIRGGYYSLDEPLVFSPEDGGERVETNLPSGAFEYHKLRDVHVTYAAYYGEQPVISGGPLIHSWERRNDLWTTSFAGEAVEVLIANGRKQIVARAPNDGYFTPPRVSASDIELPFRQGDLLSWPDLPGNRVMLLLRWHQGVNSFRQIDTAHQIAYLTTPQPGILDVPPRYYIENIKALLDAPGEWFFDSKTGELSYIPAQNSVDPQQVHIAVPLLAQLVRIQGKADRPVRNLRFYGLTFEGTRAGDKAIPLEYAHANEIVDSKVRGCAGAGIYIGKGCYQTRILDNRFEDVDNGTIAIDGNPHPEHWADIIRETFVSYNRITECGGANIAAHNTLYTTISHNEITHTRGRYAISLGGWRNLEEVIDGSYRVEYNHLHQVQKDADDSGVIKTAGLTTDSCVRFNLIHDVQAGYFNDNVGFWFDNMSSGWIVEENIYYNLEQGEMKLCAANLVDNIYRNNFVIKAPQNPPEDIIIGEPDFDYTNLKLLVGGEPIVHELQTGTYITVAADIYNRGATGILPVDLYVDGKIVQSQRFPVIHNNSRTITFGLRLYEPGEHRLAIGKTSYTSIKIVGEKGAVDVNDLTFSHNMIPHGESVIISATAENLTDTRHTTNAKLFLNGEIRDQTHIILMPGESQHVSFEITPEIGEHVVQVGNSPHDILTVFPHAMIDIDKKKLKTYGSATARPHRIDIDDRARTIKITAGGSDFFHAEDSYATAYIAKVRGNFIATVKVNGFGERTHPWFRAGLFVRNDLTLSFDTEPGSKGSVLCFTTPARAGIQWDEFGDGCMHKANSENLPEDIHFPLWLKLIRHGDSFSGALSYDGLTWEKEKKTGTIPGLRDEVDIGVAAGSCDKIPYQVEFEDFQLSIEQANVGIK